MVALAEIVKESIHGVSAAVAESANPKKYQCSRDAGGGQVRAVRANVGLDGRSDAGTGARTTSLPFRSLSSLHHSGTNFSPLNATSSASEGQSESTMAIWPRVVDAYSVQWPPPRRLALLEANLTLGHLAAGGDRAVRI
ncbi:hypothetical protein THAOC_28007, partial [Thalassiosira oceanica]